VTVGCVGDKHLVSVDADNYIFALFLQLLVLVRAINCLCYNCLC